MDIKTIAVVGAGVMGTDVAIDLASYSYPVILKDLSEDVLLKARDKIESSMRLLAMMQERFRSISSEDILSNITFTKEYDQFDQVDFVIENIIEDFDYKKNVYKELNEICKENVIIGVNTSCISITKIAALMCKPERVIGTHFMNPVPLNEMVEMIRGYHTSEATEDRIINFLKTMNKHPVVVNDMPGFVANRLSHLFMNEAAFLVQDQIADPAEIDMIFQKGYGHKMGPLHTADLIGIDTVVSSLKVLYDHYEDPKFRCCPLLKKMVHAGLLGKKVGKGFFDYN